jgi:hypothetical protein
MKSESLKVHGIVSMSELNKFSKKRSDENKQNKYSNFKSELDYQIKSKCEHGHSCEYGICSECQFN